MDGNAHPTAAALAEWRRLADNARSGPWCVDDHICHKGDTPGLWHVYETFDDDPPLMTCEDEADARFIAAARTLVPLLISAYEAERARADALMAMLHSGTWLRYAGRTDLAVRMPDGADLSCKAMREDAINKALAALAPEGAGHDE